MAGDDRAAIALLEDFFGVPVHAGAPMPAVAIEINEIHAAANPSPPALEDVMTLSDLPSLMGVAEPQTMEAAVREVDRGYRGYAEANLLRQSAHPCLITPLTSQA